MQKGNTNNGVIGQVVTYWCEVELKFSHFTNTNKKCKYTNQIQKENTSTNRKYKQWQVVTYCCAVGLKLPHFTNSAQVVTSTMMMIMIINIMIMMMTMTDEGGEMFKALLKLKVDMGMGMNCV